MHFSDVLLSKKSITDVVTKRVVNYFLNNMFSLVLCIVYFVNTIEYPEKKIIITHTHTQIYCAFFIESLQMV